jgi:diguanylate cyclase (GGDEF)-like protein
MPAVCRAYSRKCRALIIEDDPVVQTLLRTLVERRGHTVVAVTHAEEALEMLVRDPFQLIILDLHLPGMDGFEFCARLRAMPDGDQYYVLVATANQLIEDLERVLAMGANDYLAKPFDLGLVNVRLMVAEEQVADIFTRKALERELKFLAERDPMTGLLNRSGLEAAIGQAVSRAGQGEPGCMLLIDLDRFKQINDTLGHAAGDRLLMQVAEELRHQIRSQDLLYRFGGDEFVALLPATDVDQAMEIAGRIREAIERCILLHEDRSYTVECSIGLVEIDGNVGPERLMGLADAACYAAKASGGNRVHVVERRDFDAASEGGDGDWPQKIRQAMETDSLELFFQPIVDVKRAMPMAYESLVRYLDTERGWVAGPACFIAAVERAGLMGAFDFHIVRRAIRILAGIPDVVFHVNVAPGTIEDEGLVEFVTRCLREHGVSGRRLVLEMTEAGRIRDLERTARQMRELSSEGVRFALDDFCGRATDMAYLRELPLNILKLDASFLRDIETARVSREFVAAIDGLAQRLELELIAEGIETQEAAAVLAKIGVRFAQGFLWGRPQPLPLRGVIRPGYSKS